MPNDRRNAERSRQAILDAAEKLLAQKGFESTSMADVGAAANVSRGLPAYLFGNKLGLYRATIDRAAQQVRDRIRAAVAPGRALASGEETLDRFIETYIDYLAANPGVVRLLQWEFLRPAGERLSGTPEALFSDAIDALKPSLKAAGVVGPDLEQLLLSIVGMCLFPFMISPPREGPSSSHPFDPAFVSARKRHIQRLVRDGLVAPLHPGDP